MKVFLTPTLSLQASETVLCLKCVMVQWVWFDNVRLGIATSQWGLGLESPSETGQERLTAPGWGRNV